MKTITKPYKIIYHVFADNFDEWTGTLGEANRVYKDLNIQGYRNIRIYKETYELSLKESDEQLKLSRRKRKKPPVEAVLTSVCPDCGDLLVADVCMNSRCAKETVQV